MRVEHLEAGLDHYGGDLSRWPAEHRAEAEALAATEPKAAALIAAARRLDRALADLMQPMAVDAALIGRIVGSIAAGAHHDVTVRPTRRLVAWAGAAMVALLVSGYAAGIAIPQSQGEDAFAGLIFGNSDTSDSASTDSGSVL